MLKYINGYGFVQNIAPPSLSRDRKIKMEQTNNLAKSRNFKSLKSKIKGRWDKQPPVPGNF